ncbi:ATP-binding protein [Paenibacillus psychroresistens]|nr:ATP-binding protein [Paenibacillus psychroresistens]
MSHTKQNHSLSYEMILWISLLIVLPLVILAFYFYSTMTSGLKDLEKEQAIIKSQAAEKLFDKLGESILGVTISNGLWGDNRDALLNKDIEWLQQNIYTISDLVPNIDFVAEADLLGQVIIQHGDVSELTDLVKLPTIMERFQDTQGFTGVTDTSKGLAIVAVSPVTGDDGLDKPVGMLVTGRFIDSAILKSIQSTLQSDLAVLLHSGQFLSSNEAISKNKLSGFLNDLQTAGNQKNAFTTEKHNNVSMAKVAVSFQDMADQTIGDLYLESPSNASGEVEAGLRKLGIYAGIIMILLLILVSYLLRRRIILPLRQFAITMERMASGAPVDEIPKNVMQADAEIVGAFQKIIHWNHSLEKTVEQRTLAIRNLLDSAGQGFMSFGADLIISDEHSVECNRIFNQEVARNSLPELLYPNDVEEQKLLKSILDEYFQEQDVNAKELIFSLLPAEVYIQQIPIQLDYKIIEDNQEMKSEALMVVLTDISEKRLLEHKMDAERHLLKMVVKVVTNYDDFVEMVREYEHFYQTELYEFLHTRGTLEQHILTIFKKVHTLKGNCGLMYLIHVAPNLHLMEEQLSNLLKQKELITSEKFIELIASFPMKQWLDEDIALLQDILGDEFLQDEQTNVIVIDLEKLIEFEYKIAKLLKEDKDKTLLLELRKWRYKPVRTFFRSYPEFIQRLADREGIFIHPLVIEGGDTLVDPEWFQPFARTLIHTLRNVIVHGIEDSEERIDAGKEQYGTIQFKIQMAEEQIHLTISDDGRGIDLEHIRTKLVEKGQSESDDAKQLSDDELLEFIFAEEFSTKQEVSDLAGRGVGLSAVKSAVEILGGAVNVKTMKGRGTTFEFYVPLPEAN